MLVIQQTRMAQLEKARVIAILVKFVLWSQTVGFSLSLLQAQSPAGLEAWGVNLCLAAKSPARNSVTRSK